MTCRTCRERVGILTGKGDFVDRMVGSLDTTKYAFDIEKDYNPRDLAERSLKAVLATSIRWTPSPWTPRHRLAST